MGKTEIRTGNPVYGYPKKQKKGREHPRFNRLFTQTIVSAMLFLFIFVGGGLLPSNTVDVFGLVAQTIREESRLPAAVEALGSAVIEGENWKNALAEVFLPDTETAITDVYWEMGELYRLGLHPNAKVK